MLYEEKKIKEATSYTYFIIIKFFLLIDSITLFTYLFISLITTTNTNSKT